MNAPVSPVLSIRECLRQRPRPRIKGWVNHWRFDGDKTTLPTMYDLPSEDPEEPGLPDDFHYWQPQLLRETFQPDPELVERFYVATDMNLYYDPARTNRYKRPDWFAVLGAGRFSHPDNELRFSYVVWQEELAPYLVVELLSPGTEEEDMGLAEDEPDRPPGKWEVYERYLKIPYYVVYSRYTHEVGVFGLVQGVYEELSLEDRRGDVASGLWLPEAGLGLGLWEGVFEGIEGKWLRFYDAKGQWCARPVEQERQKAEQERQKAEQERQKAEQERQKAEQEYERAERLAKKLRALGIDPDAIE
jgi:Uma2 family endonuclease